MRTKLDKRHFTKAERIIGRMLQENHIPFKTKQKVGNREIDFLIGRLAIEIDGHEQSTFKNNELVKLGYIPIHFHNSEIYNNRKKVLKRINVNKI